MDIAATGVVAGERRWLFPGLAATARVLVVAVREGLMPRNPKALNQEKNEERRRYALREVEVESAKAGEWESHQRWRSDSSSLNVASHVLAVACSLQDEPYETALISGGAIQCGTVFVCRKCRKAAHGERLSWFKDL